MRRESTSTSLWMLCVGVGVGLVAATIVVPSTDYVWYALACLSVAGAISVAMLRGAISRRVVYLAAAIGACSTSSVVAAATIADAQRSAIVATLFGLCGTAGLIIGLHRVLLSRHGRAAERVVGDSVLVGLGAWVVAWATLAQPQGRIDTTTWLASSVNSLSPATGAVALFLVVSLLPPPRPGRASGLLVTGAAVFYLAADLIIALANARHVSHGTHDVAISLYVLAYMLAAAGFLHPSITSVAEMQSVGPMPGIFGRVGVATLTLALPIAVLAIVDARSTSDKVIRCVSAVLLAGAVTIRTLHGARATRHVQAELLLATQTDALTGLATRALLLERLSQRLQDSWHGDLRPVLYFVDLDRFKNINDSHGYGAGDQVLRSVAQRLLSVVPERAMVARLAGDEYAVLDPARAGESPILLADRILAVFAEPISLHHGDVFVTASVGIATVESNTRTEAEGLLRQACTAMYRAKDAGRNRAVRYVESMHERVAHRMSVETALYRALDRRELKLYHQPILDIVTGDVVGFEALMRWQRDDGTIVSPGEFIPIAEDNGTIIPIGSWALLDALSQLRRWIDDDVCSPAATMSVNVSPRQLADPRFPSIVSDVLNQSGVDPSSVWLEITEGVMISEPELALATLEKVKSLGVLIALDDFGTGYSSLSMLQRFPLQRIKIDRAFVQGLAESEGDRSLVRTIIAMAASLDLDVVAEGVETAKQMQVLRDLGCHKAQGYLISHPMPADAMRSTVAALERLQQTPLLRSVATLARR